VEATLDGLIHQVREDAEDELSQLERASQLSEELGELADSLLTYFVDRCRVSGRTWAEIGAHLGVSRQAAQKRFVDTVGAGVTFERFTMRARHTLDRASEVAESMHHNYVGTEHLLLALIDTAGGVAALALADLGISRRAVATAITDAVGEGHAPAPGPHPFTPRARKVLEEGVNVSVELGHNYVGTEHLLLGLYRGQDGLASQILNQLGADRQSAKAKVIELLAGYQG
jgi:Clp amino terminal domain, pathogenicity island component